MMVIKERRGLFVSVLLFTLYILAFFLTENAVNAGSERFESINVSATYAIGLFCTAGGYLLFSVSRSFARGQKARKFLLLTISVIFVISVVLFLVANNPALFLIFALLSLLCFALLWVYRGYGTL